MSTVRWGIAGTGRVADLFVEEFPLVKDAEVSAVASRDEQRALAFAQKHAIPRSFANYVAMLESPDVDVVYVATPNTYHKMIALAAIEAGKAVVVEKSFTAELASAQEIVDAARDKGVFVMEAMWTRFFPAYRKIHSAINSGMIGEVLAIQGDLYAQRHFDPRDRYFAAELGGGAVLDLGVYVLSFAQDFLGTPESVQATGTLFSNGVDASASMLLSYPGGKTATLDCALRCDGPGRMIIMGSEGWIDVEPRFHHPRRVWLHRQGTLPKLCEAEHEGRGYSYEIAAVTQAIQAGRTECEFMPLDDTLAVQEVMSEVLRQVGYRPTDNQTPLAEYLKGRRG